MTRFDFDKQTRDAFNAAVEQLRIIDAVELGCLMVEHGTDAAAIMNEITEAAYADRHGNRSKHALWCSINDDWHKARREAVK